MGAYNLVRSLQISAHLLIGNRFYNFAALLHCAHTLSVRGKDANLICARPTRASGFPLYILSPSHLRESPDRPSLRASSDHRFTVGALRARRMVACPLHLLASGGGQFNSACRPQ